MDFTDLFPFFSPLYSKQEQTFKAVVLSSNSLSQKLLLDPEDSLVKQWLKNNDPHPGIWPEVIWHVFFGLHSITYILLYIYIFTYSTYFLVEFIGVTLQYIFF